MQLGKTHIVAKITCVHVNHEVSFNSDCYFSHQRVKPFVWGCYSTFATFTSCGIYLGRNSFLLVMHIGNFMAVSRQSSNVLKHCKFSKIAALTQY